jgi:hypothetical protein
MDQGGDPRANFMAGLLDALTGIRGFPVALLPDRDGVDPLGEFRLIIVSEGLLDDIFGADVTARDQALNDLVREAFEIFMPYMPGVPDTAQAAVQTEVHRRAGAEGVQNAVAFLFAGIGAQMQRLQNRQAPPAGQSWIDWFIGGAAGVMETFRGVIAMFISAARAGMSGVGTAVGAAAALGGVAASAAYAGVKAAISSVQKFMIRKGLIAAGSGGTFRSARELLNAFLEAHRTAGGAPNIERFIATFKYIPSDAVRVAAEAKGCSTLLCKAARFHIATGNEENIALRHLLLALVRLEEFVPTLDAADVDMSKVSKRIRRERRISDFIQAYYVFVLIVNEHNYTRESVERLLAISRENSEAGANNFSQHAAFNTSATGNIKYSTESQELETTANDLRPLYILCMQALGGIRERAGLVNPAVLDQLVIPVDFNMFPRMGGASSAIDQAATRALVQNMQTRFRQFLSTVLPAGGEVANLTYASMNARAKLAALAAREAAAEVAAAAAAAANAQDAAELAAENIELVGGAAAAAAAAAAAPVSELTRAQAARYRSPRGDFSNMGANLEGVRRLFDRIDKSTPVDERNLLLLYAVIDNAASSYDSARGHGYMPTNGAAASSSSSAGAVGYRGMAAAPAPAAAASGGASAGSGLRFVIEGGSWINANTYRLPNGHNITRQSDGSWRSTDGSIYDSNGNQIGAASSGGGGGGAAASSSSAVGAAAGVRGYPPGTKEVELPGGVRGYMYGELLIQHIILANGSTAFRLSNGTILDSTGREISGPNSGGGGAAASSSSSAANAAVRPPIDSLRRAGTFIGAAGPRARGRGGRSQVFGRASETQGSKGSEEEESPYLLPTGGQITGKRSRNPEKAGINGTPAKRPETNAAVEGQSSLPKPNNSSGAAASSSSSAMAPPQLTTVSDRPATRHPDGTITYNDDGTVVPNEDIPPNLRGGSYRRRRRTHRRKHHVTHKRPQPRRVHRVKASRRRAGGKSRKAGRR